MMTPSVVTRTISMQTEFNPFKTVRLSQESNDSTVVRLEVDGGWRNANTRFYRVVKYDDITTAPSYVPTQYHFVFLIDALGLVI